MTNSVNKINVFNTVFEKTKKVFVENIKLNQKSLGENADIAISLQVNIEPYGFALSKESIIALSHLSKNDLSEIGKNLISVAAKSVGGHQQFTPMYPNFPKQVLQASDLELLMNAFVHYAGDYFGVRILPKYKEKNRKPLKEDLKAKIVEIATMKDVESLFANLVTANSSLSDSDKESLKFLFAYLNEKNKAESILSISDIPQKENLAVIGGLVLNSEIDFNKVLGDKFKTPTDMLRLIAALFDGDVSLAQATKLGKLSRPYRKAILARLEQQFLDAEDKEQLVENYFTYAERWKRVAHVMHSNEYANKFATVVKTLNDVRAGNQPQTFNSKAEELMSKNKMVEASELLSQRPGVLVRNLNRLLSVSDKKSEQNAILENLKSSASSVATPVLLQAHSHFLNQKDKEVRTFMPKGGLGSLYVIDNENKILDKDLAKKVAEICEDALVERFKSFAPLGKVFVDKDLKLQNLPFAQRSASKALNSVARGSRFDIEKDKNIVRLFLWWNETDKNKDLDVGRVDIDLSCVLMDKDFNTIRVCSYYDLRSENGSLLHSGDITSAPNGACEFIDVNLSKLDDEVCYVVMTLNSYTSQKYCDMPECFAGWMMREKAKRGEIFDARTVENKIDLTSDSTMMMPAIFDVKKRQFVWADIAIKQNPYGYNNVASNETSIAYNVKAIVNMVKPNLYDLFVMHAKARGEMVDSKEDADTIFSIHDGVTPYMFETIASEFIANEAPKNSFTKKLKL